MAINQIVKWDAPTRASIGTVDDVGAVVFVCISPQSGAAALGASASGVLPHIVYSPTIEPQGSTSFQMVDLGTMQLGPHVADGVRTFAKSSFPDKHREYWIDLACPFVAPWVGDLFIEGGASAGGLPSPQDIEVIISRPELRGEMMNVVNGALIPFTRHRLEIIGQRPMRSPTISYANVGSTPIQIPRGAKEIVVPDTSGVNFVVGGTTFANLRIAPGSPQPLGYLAGGTFAASGGGTIQLVSFLVEIA